MTTRFRYRSSSLLSGSLVLSGLLIVSILSLAGAGKVAAADPARDAKLEEVRKYIEENGYSWTAGHTQISDLPPEEAQKLLGTRLPEDYYDRLEQIRAKEPIRWMFNPPSRFDWTDSAAVSPVRNQLCGDCWAQCSVAALESQFLILDDDDTQLSVQQVIDCNYGNSDCNGGWWEHTYDLYRVVGAVRETSYPYVGANGTCAEDTCEIVTRVDGWDYIDTTVESIKTHLMTDGPIAVGMTVYGDFGYYTEGCYERAGTAEVNHGVLVVGWDDSKCGGQGAWHIKNSWGTYWGEEGYAWLKYGTCRIGEGAVIIHYTPRQRARLVYASHVISDSSGDSDGRPDPGETIVLPVSIKNKRWLTATDASAAIVTSTPGVHVITGSASFPDVSEGETEQSDPPHFSFSVDSSCPCGMRIDFIVSITCNQGIFTDRFDVLVGDAETVFADDCENDLGWSLSVPDDGATSGRFARKNPNGSLLDSMLVQCELDHTPGSGVRCYVTANVPRQYSPEVGDVDGGKITITSPVIDLSMYASARLCYWRWYTNDTGQNPPDDVWKVDVSGDSGATWVNLEMDPLSQREWVAREFNLGDYSALGDKVRVRFIASDFGDESTVEAGVDDVEITGCPYWVDSTPPAVTVMAPDGGEQITENADYQVMWHGSDDYGIRRFRVLASYDGGLTFPDTLGVPGPTDSVLVWHVPSGEHLSSKIRVEAEDRGYNEGFDESDALFSIVREAASVSEVPKEGVPDRVVFFGSERNPFTGFTHIFFGLPERIDVRIAIYDATGRLTRELLSGATGPGYHSVVWDGTSSSGNSVSPGIYFVRLEAGSAEHTAKVVLAR